MPMLLAGTWQEKVTCQGCQGSSSSTPSFIQIPLPIEEVDTALTLLLTDWFANENVSYQSTRTGCTSDCSNKAVSGEMEHTTEEETTDER